MRLLSPWALVATTNRAQGMYADGVEGLLMEENLFDHNGWNESIADAGPNQWSQNCYLNVNNTDVMVRDNVFARAPQQRGSIQRGSGSDRRIGGWGQ